MAYFFISKVLGACFLLLGAVLLLNVRYFAWKYLPKGRCRKVLLSADKPLPPHPND